MVMTITLNSNQVQKNHYENRTSTFEVFKRLIVPYVLCRESFEIPQEYFTISLVAIFGQFFKNVSFILYTVYSRK